MTYKLPSQFTAFQNAMEGNRIKEAIALLKEIEGTIRDSGFKSAIASAEQRYFFMLRLMVSPAGFPADDAIDGFESVKSRLRRIADDLERRLRTDNDPSPYFSQLRFARMRPEESVESLMADYIQEHASLMADTLALTDTSRRKRLEQLASDIFMHIWTERELSDDTAELIAGMILDPALPDYDREMWVAALGLSEEIDANRYSVLDRIRRKGTPRISVAALVWMFVCITRIARNGTFDVPVLTGAMAKIAQQSPDEIIGLVAEFEKQRQTADKSRNLGEQLRGFSANISPETASDPEKLMAAMPEGSFDKIKEFGEAQSRGDDVFAATLGNMRHFPFFAKPSVWFLPFHMNRSELAEIVDSEGAGMMSFMEKMPMLCDSDKFALALMIAQTPAHLRASMFAGNYQTLESLEQSPEGREALEALDKEKPRGDLINNYVKHLARFSKSFAGASDMGLDNLRFSAAALSWAGFDHDSMRRLADTVFDTGNYRLAMDLYMAIGNNDADNNDAELQRRLARTFAASGMAFAVEHYLRAIELEPDARLAMEAARYIMDNDFDTLAGTDIDAGELPLTILRPYAEIMSDDVGFTELFGDACIRAHDYAKAVDTFYKLEYISEPGDTKARLKLGKALLANGDYSGADSVLEAFSNDEDAINRRLAVIAMWLAGRRREAIDTLIALARRAQNPGDEIDAMKQLINDFAGKNQPEASTLPLLLETARYATQGSSLGSIL